MTCIATSLTAYASDPAVSTAGKEPTRGPRHVYLLLFYVVPYKWQRVCRNCILPV